MLLKKNNTLNASFNLSNSLNFISAFTHFFLSPSFILEKKYFKASMYDSYFFLFH